MAPTLQIPSSLRYDPTDEQMMSCLINKIEGRPVASALELPFIKEINIYGRNETPRDILKENLPWKDSKDGKTSTIFVITQLSKQGTKINRLAGCGRWDQKPASKPLTIGDYKGKQRTLYFKPSPDPSPDRKGEGWRMHEISIPECNMAMCRITKTFPNKKKEKTIELTSNRKRELAEEGNSHGKKHCMSHIDILHDEEQKKLEELLLSIENDEVFRQLIFFP